MLLNLEKANQSYKNNDEIINDYKILIEAIIEQYNFTYDEEYYETINFKKDNIFQEDEATNYIKIVINHITDRENLTIDYDNIPMLKVMRSLDLNKIEEIIFSILFIKEISPECAKALKNIVKARNERDFNFGIIYDLLRCSISISIEDFLNTISDNSTILNYCIEKSIKQRMDGFLTTTCCMKASIILKCYGQKKLDSNLNSFCEIYNSEGTEMIGNELYLEQILSGLNKQNIENTLVINIQGNKNSGRRLLLSKAAKMCGMTLLHVDLGYLLKILNYDLNNYLYKILTEAKLSNSLIYFEYNYELDEDKQQKVFLICNFIIKETFRLAISFPKVNNPQLGDSIININLDLTSLSKRKEIWENMLKNYAIQEDLSIEDFSSKYKIVPGDIKKSIIMADMKRECVGEIAIKDSFLKEAILENGSLDFKGFATSIPLVYSWEDMELEKSSKDILMLACNRISLQYKVGEVWKLNKKLAYGRGISILFYGAPGTGKTMGAQVMAKEIGMELFRVDLSQLVSKYIGETEKNLRKVFDEANKGNVILFFDEADSMFSKRTEVTGSNDKYANAETAFLLQKMEEYTGITILATNLLNNFDSAILRRITYSVKFEQPDYETRLKLWKMILPDTISFSYDVDLEFFARKFELSGSNIKSILYSAAYIAANEYKNSSNNSGGEISAKHIVKAIKLEYEKLGMFIQKGEFEQYGCFY